MSNAALAAQLKTLGARDTSLSALQNTFANPQGQQNAASPIAAALSSYIVARKRKKISDQQAALTKEHSQNSKDATQNLLAAMGLGEPAKQKNQPAQQVGQPVNQDRGGQAPQQLGVPINNQAPQQPSLASALANPNLDPKVKMMILKQQLSKGSAGPISSIGKTLSDFDKFGGGATLEQKRQAYINALSGKKGTNINVNLNNGNTKVTKNKLQSGVFQAQKTKDLLDAIQRDYKPSFFTYESDIKDFGARIFEKASGKLSPESKKRLGEKKAFISKVTHNFSLVLKVMSGVAVNPQEMDRARKYLPNYNDSSTEFEFKLKSMIEWNNRVILRHKYALSRGLDPSAMFDPTNKDFVSIDNIEQIVKRERPELLGDVNSKAKSRAEAISKANPKMTREQIIKRVKSEIQSGKIK